MHTQELRGGGVHRHRQRCHLRRHGPLIETKHSVVPAGCPWVCVQCNLRVRRDQQPLASNNQSGGPTQHGRESLPVQNPSWLRAVRGKWNDVERKSVPTASRDRRPGRRRGFSEADEIPSHPRLHQIVGQIQVKGERGVVMVVRRPIPAHGSHAALRDLWASCMAPKGNVVVINTATELLPHNLHRPLLRVRILGEHRPVHCEFQQHLGILPINPGSRRRQHPGLLGRCLRGLLRRVPGIARCPNLYLSRHALPARGPVARCPGAIAHVVGAAGGGGD
mmetsp:Transcript_38508/g.86489  ORF Transcript_38508/g.86489 Transcript_38508/m.86489 type:complete len:278 (-) Transcript_38508:1983-2816(-)